MFEISDRDIDITVCRDKLLDHASGGYVAFEGWVRNHNEGQAVDALEYEIFDSLALKEGAKIISEAKERFDIKQVFGVHRKGLLELGGIAVWLGVSSAHRDAAYQASRYIIDELKTRLPIWKKEHYQNGDAHWVNCKACSSVKSKASVVQESAPQLSV